MKGVNWRGDQWHVLRPLQSLALLVVLHHLQVQHLQSQAQEAALLEVTIHSPLSCVLTYECFFQINNTQW